jgi:hypothetical protein
MAACFRPSSLPSRVLPFLLNVDATQVDRGVIRVEETLPTSGGKKSFYFPKFIPGEHRASGPINYLFDLHFYGNGKELEWNRDGAELFKFIVDVPSAVDHIEAKFAMTSEFRQPVQPGQTVPRGERRFRKGWTTLRRILRGLSGIACCCIQAVRPPIRS